MTDDYISDEEIDLFCKNCAVVQKVNTSSIADELSGGTSSITADTIRDILESELFDVSNQVSLLCVIKPLQCYSVKTFLSHDTI